jgi:hypothetical protein
MERFPHYFNLDAVHVPPDEDALAKCNEELGFRCDEILALPPRPSSAADIRLLAMDAVVTGGGVGRIEVNVDSPDVDIVVEELRALDFEVTERIANHYEGSQDGVPITTVKRTLLIEKYVNASFDYVLSQDPGHTGFAEHGFFGGLAPANAYGIGRH